jgi:hypothetical protein
VVRLAQRGGAPIGALARGPDSTVGQPLLIIARGGTVIPSGFPGQIAEETKRFLEEYHYFPRSDPPSSAATGPLSTVKY